MVQKFWVLALASAVSALSAGAVYGNEAGEGMPYGRPLGPLLEEDQHSPEKMGCNVIFMAPEGRYLSIIDGELMVRTPTGLQLCPISDAQLQSLGEPGGEV